MASITPRRIEWAGPSGYVVILDEDGVNLRSSGTSLEEGELDTLLDIISAAKSSRDDRRCITPQVPPRESWQEIRLDHAAARVVRMVEKAITDEAQPF